MRKDGASRRAGVSIGLRPDGSSSLLGQEHLPGNAPSVNGVYPERGRGVFSVVGFSVCSVAAFSEGDL